MRPEQDVDYAIIGPARKAWSVSGGNARRRATDVEAEDARYVLDESEEVRDAY